MKAPRSAALAWAVLATSVPTSAATHEVRSIDELRARLDVAEPGDVILVREGVYEVRAPLMVQRAGTQAAPIRVAARRRREVRITGTHGLVVTGPAAHVTIEGFVFEQASETTAIESGATHVRFTDNVFRCSGEGAYLIVAGNDAEIDHNEFRDKHTVGNMLDVRGAGTQVAQRVRVHHNYFHDFRNAGKNGAETIRFGRSGLSMSKGHGLVEHNLFVRCMGENELITNKSGANTYRYNTFLDSPGAQLTLRHGNECQVYGNVFRRTDGLRIFGDRHQVFGNYLEGNRIGIQIGNGGAEVADGAPLTSHDRPDGCAIRFNILVDNERPYYMAARKDGLGATGTVFADNVLQGGGPAATLEGPYPGGVWRGNVVWRTNGAGALPAGGYQAVDPGLVRDADGILRLRPGGRMLDPAKADLPAVVDRVRPLSPSDFGAASAPGPVQQ